MFNLIDLESGEKVLDENEEKVCYLTSIDENIQRNVILYNVLSDASFHTLVSNLNNWDVNMNIVIYADNLLEGKRIAEKIINYNKPFNILTLANALQTNYNLIEIENEIYLVTMPLVINSGSIRMNNENESIELNLTCKPFIQQKITVIESYFGYTRDGRKWLKLLESLLK